jgi:hypothetical protein
MIGLAFTKEQYATLLKMIFIANTVANGRREPGEFLDAYEELERYVFSRAKDADLPAAAERHATEHDGDHFHPSRMFEDDQEIARLMDEYDDAMFWDGLADRLAERDIRLAMGANAKDRLPADEYEERFEERAKEYDEEFEARELERVRIEGLPSFRSEKSSEL